VLHMLLSADKSTQHKCVIFFFIKEIQVIYIANKYEHRETAPSSPKHRAMRGSQVDIL
jgi:hypothetical protein